MNQARQGQKAPSALNNLPIGSRYSGRMAWAQRFALAPFVGLKPGKATVLKSALAARKRWKGLVFDLKKAGWGPLQKETALWYHSRCPPADHQPIPGKLFTPCNRPLVCPFCYCRRVVGNTYRRLADVLFGEGGHETDLVNPLLVTWVKRTPIRGIRTDAEFGAAMSQFVRDINETRASERRKINKLEALGAVRHHAIYPIRHGKSQALTLVHRQVTMAVFPGGPYLPEEADEANGGDGGWRILRSSQLSPRVGSALTFPKTLYQYLSMPRLILYLNRLAHVTMFTAYGKCRGVIKSIRIPDEEDM